MGAEYLELDNAMGPIEWVVFLVMLLGATLVGFYFGYWRTDKIMDKEAVEEQQEGARKHFDSEALDEYFVGRAALKAFPVGMTLVGTYISAVTVLGTPAEMYLFGTQQMFVIFSIAISSVLVAYFFMPVFLNLQLDSSYEYLEMRFNRGIRTLASFLFMLDNIFFMPVTFYIPTKCFEMFTGIDYMITSAVVMGLVMVYTLFGGVKVVVYTDTWQVYVMFVSVVFAVSVAIHQSGGLLHTIREANDGGRFIFFNMDFSLYERYTFWSVIIGNGVYWTAFNSINQTMVQRYMSLPSINKARLALLYFSIAMILFELVIYFGGVAMYSYFRGCDPKQTGFVEKSDYMFPKFILYSVSWLPGLSGFFLSGVFGASLSSLSVIMNSLSLVLYHDIITGFFKIQLSERAANLCVKLSIVVFACCGLALVPLINMLDTVFAVAIGLTAINNSTIFSMFALGMLVPFGNWKGALVGAICAFIVTATSTFGTHFAQQNGYVVKEFLPLSNELCPQRNFTPQVVPDESGVFPFFRLSYLWVNLSGVATGLLIGILVSLITGPSKAKDMDAALFSPVIHSCLPDECFEGSVIKRKKKEAKD